MTAKNGKPCKKCGENEWYKSGSCAPCAREARRQYRAKNKLDVDAYNSEYSKGYYQRNKEAIKDQALTWRQENLEKAAENGRRWREANPGRVVKNRRRWLRENPEKANAFKHRRRAKLNKAGGHYTASQWKEICERYGNKCLCCGSTKRKLTVDHIKPISKGGSNWPSNLQPLCKSCNSKKGDRYIDYRPDSGIKHWIQRKLFG